MYIVNNCIVFMCQTLYTNKQKKFVVDQYFTVNFYIVQNELLNESSQYIYDAAWSSLFRIGLIL
jgi:hypothetical protein